MDRTWGRDALHSIDDLDGIGSVTARHLASFGLGTVEELASRPKSSFAVVADQVAGLTERQLRESLLPQAWFHLLGRDGAAAAKGLVGAGIRSYIRLVAMPTTRIVNILGDGWDRDRVAQLQLDAARESWCFRVLIQTLSSDGSPLRSVLEVGGVGFDSAERVVTHQGDDQGWVLSPLLRRDRAHHLSIQADVARRSVYVRPRPPQIQLMTVRFGEAPRNPITEVTLPARPRLLAGHETFVTEPTAFDSLDDGTALSLVGADDTGATLLSLHRRISGATVITYRVTVPSNDLPGGVNTPGTLLIKDNGTLRAAGDDERKTIAASRGAALLGRSRD